MGPLHGIRVLELAGIGPAPFCGMLLADLGAEVVRVERAEADEPPNDPLQRNRRSIALDLKQPAGCDALLALVERADALIEGFRPGVAERLGVGPEACLERNPRLVYGRVTGWGRDGPLAHAAGHDLNYVALAGALHEIGPAGGRPVAPLNLVGDFGGGGMLLAVGVLAALVEARASGAGQVVDAAMVDGTLALLGHHLGLLADGAPGQGTGESLFSGAAPYYDTYETADGRYVAIAALEPQFFALLLERLGLDGERFGATGYPSLDERTRRELWPGLRSAIAEAVRGRTRDEWCELLEGTDVCFAPVLTLEEARRHPHNVARAAFIEVDGVVQGAPAPRFGRTPAGAPQPPRRPGEDTAAVLADWGVSAARA